MAISCHLEGKDLSCRQWVSNWRRRSNVVCTKTSAEKTSNSFPIDNGLDRYLCILCYWELSCNYGKHVHINDYTNWQFFGAKDCRTTETLGSEKETR